MGNGFKNERACDVMLLIITKMHLRKLDDITSRVWSSFHEVVTWIESKYALPGGMLFMRFGDMRYNVGTVPHLHWNLWVPNRKDSVLIPLFKTKELWQAHNDKMSEFSVRFERGESI